MRFFCLSSRCSLLHCTVYRSYDMNKILFFLPITVCKLFASTECDNDRANKFFPEKEGLDWWKHNRQQPGFDINFKASLNKMGDWSGLVTHPHLLPAQLWAATRVKWSSRMRLTPKSGDLESGSFTGSGAIFIHPVRVEAEARQVWTESGAGPNKQMESTTATRTVRINIYSHPQVVTRQLLPFRNTLQSKGQPGMHSYLTAVALFVLTKPHENNTKFIDKNQTILEQRLTKSDMALDRI